MTCHCGSDHEDQAEGYGVFANARGDKVLRPGALVRLVRIHGDDPDRALVTGLSRGGRMVEIWRSVRLYIDPRSIRVKWVGDRFRRRHYGAGEPRDVADVHAIVYRKVVASAFIARVARVVGHAGARAQGGE